MALCASFDRIREFVLSHALLFRNDGGEVDGSGAPQDAVFPVLHAHPNQNHMGALRRRKRGQGGGERLRENDNINVIDMEWDRHTSSRRG